MAKEVEINDKNAKALLDAIEAFIDAKIRDYDGRVMPHVHWVKEKRTELRAAIGLLVTGEKP